jgi:hypothetical protein
VSDRFINSLCNADGNINKVWITTGNGDMLKLKSQDDVGQHEINELKEIIKEKDKQKPSVRFPYRGILLIIINCRQLIFPVTALIFLSVTSL